MGSLSRFRDGVDHLFVTALVASGVRRAGIDPAAPTPWVSNTPLAKQGHDRCTATAIVERSRSCGCSGDQACAHPQFATREPLAKPGDRPGFLCRKPQARDGQWAGRSV